MDYASTAQGIHLKRAKSFTSSAFNVNPPQNPSRLSVEQNVLKSAASSMNFFTRATGEDTLHEPPREPYSPMHRAQSMRVPPGFDTFESKGILEMEDDFESSLLDLEHYQRPRDKHLKRFVTYNNLSLAKKSSFRAASEFSDDEDEIVDVIEDETLMEITSDNRRPFNNRLFEPVDVNSMGSTSTNTSSPHRRRHKFQSNSGKVFGNPSHSYSHSQIPLRTSRDNSIYAERPVFPGRSQPYHPLTPQHSQAQRNLQMEHFQQHINRMGSPYAQEDYVMQNRMLMDLVMKQNALLQQQQVHSNRYNAPSQPQHYPQVEKNVSSMLVRHKTTGYRPTVAELEGSVLEFSRDSHGSRLVQSLMEQASPRERAKLITEVMPDVIALMQDLFGNYVVQNFLEHCNEAQKEELASKIKVSMNLLSFQPHGCRVVQRAIDVLSSDQRNRLLEEVVFPKDKIIVCAKDPHATHVLQKAVVLLQRELLNERIPISTNELNKRMLDAIEEAVAADILKLAIHPHACRLVQKVLGDCKRSRSAYVGRMLDVIRTVYASLSVDQHGNFILQHIIDNGDKKQKMEIQAYVCSRFLELAQHKFGSHLVEKCLNCSNKEEAFNLVTELLKPALSLRKKKGDSLNFSDKDSSDILLNLMKDPYANFVVQRAYDACEGSLKDQLKREVQERSDILSRFTYGRHILSHVNKG